MTKKYELTDETTLVGNTVLHRIRALVNIPKHNVKSGDLGGLIEKESNLSHNGECWIHGDACVYGNACISGDALIYDNACVFGNARVYDNACVFGNAWIYDSAWIHGNARVYNNARVYGNAWIYGNALIHGNACVYNNARVFGNAWIYDSAWIHGNACVFGNARVFGNAWIYGSAWIYGDACVCGKAHITQGKYHVSTVHIIVLPYNITAIYPNHVKIGCGLFEICDKETAIETMKRFNISKKYHEQMWISVQLCKQWLKDNPEKGE